MNFKIDENLPVALADDLRQLGHDVHLVPEEGLMGVSDDRLLAAIQEEKRILLTMDVGIGNIRTYPPQNFAGIVLFRPKTAGAGEVLAFIRRYLPHLLQYPLAGRLLIVSSSGIRQR